MPSNNVTVKVNADRGNTVLFKTQDTGGHLFISLDGTEWYKVGAADVDVLSLNYSFIGPLNVSTSREVYLSIATGDNVSSGETLRAVVVGDSGRIGYNLLPDIVKDLQGSLDPEGKLLKSRLPDDIVYSVEGKLPAELLPEDNTITWIDYTNEL